MDELVNRLIKRFGQLNDEALEHMTMMQEVAEHLQPERATFTGKKSLQNEREKMFDSTGEDALQILASNIHSYLTPAVHAWILFGLFGEDAADISEEVSEWVNEVTNKMLDEFNSEEGGFHTSAFELYMDTPSFGTGGFFVDEIEGKAYYTCMLLSEIRFSENAKGVADTLFRERSLTASYINERWPKHGVEAITRALAKEPDRKFKILQVIQPRKKSKKDAIRGKDMPFASYVIELSSKKLIHESGFMEQPFMIPRWLKRSGEKWGRGLGQKALPDLRVLNAMNRSLLIAGEKQADPPTLLPHDGFIGDFSSDGGALNFYRSTGDMKDRVITLDSKANLSALDAIIERRQLQVRKMFLNDKLQAPTGPQRTAEEVRAILNANKRILAPVMGRFQGEFLSILVPRQFGIMYRNDRIPQPPEELQGRDLKIKYISEISRIQKQTEAEGFTQAMQYLGPIVQVDPSIVRNFDFHKVARDTPELFGYPTKYLKDPSVIKKEEEAAQAQMQAQQEMQDASNAMTVAGQAKELMSEEKAKQ